MEAVVPRGAEGRERVRPPEPPEGAERTLGADGRPRVRPPDPPEDALVVGKVGRPIVRPPEPPVGRATLDEREGMDGRLTTLLELGRATRVTLLPRE